MKRVDREVPARQVDVDLIGEHDVWFARIVGVGLGVHGPAVGRVVYSCMRVGAEVRLAELLLLLSAGRPGLALWGLPEGSMALQDAQGTVA